MPTGSAVNCIEASSVVETRRCNRHSSRRMHSPIGDGSPREVGACIAANEVTLVNAASSTTEAEQLSQLVGRIYDAALDPDGSTESLISTEVKEVSFPA